MNILVIGAGAIGCMVSARLQGAGHPVSLVARPHTAERLAARGLRVEEADGSVHAVRVTVMRSVAEAAMVARPFDLALIAVKAYSTAEVGRALQTAGGVPSVLTVQNGVGNEETLAAYLPSSPILSGALTTPVETIAPGHVRVARPSFRFGLAPGPGAGDVTAVAQIFEELGFKVQTIGDYRALKWSKLLMNILANAQSAILRRTPAQIFADPRLGDLEVLAWREALAVMAGLGVKPVSFGGYPLPLAAAFVRRLPLALTRPALGRFIAGGRGSKMPSLYYDLFPHLRSHSEVGWLNGAVADAGRELGIPTPVNAAFTAILTDIIAGRSEPAQWADQPARLLAAVAAR